MPNTKVQPVQRFPQLSTLNPQLQLNPVNSVDFGNQNCTGSGGVRFPGPKNAVFACIGGLGTRFPGAVPNGSRGSQPVSMVQFFPPWPGQLPTPNHPATCIICVSAPVPVHSTFVSLIGAEVTSLESAARRVLLCFEEKGGRRPDEMRRPH
jgi:hypothetical protein